MQPNENNEYTLNTTEIDGEDGSITILPDFESIEIAVLDSLREVLVETMLDCDCPIPEVIDMKLGIVNAIIIKEESKMAYDIRRFLRWLFPRQYQ